MSDECNIQHPLKREGTYQFSRLPEGLKNGFLKPDDRTSETIIRQMALYAKQVNFYNEQLLPDGDWTQFFRSIYNYDNGSLQISKIDDLRSSGKVVPNNGLLLTFLKLFEAFRSNYNDFTKRHLDFYYKDVLRLSPKPATPDRVALIFTPEKNIAQAKVPVNTIFPAGKDALGNELQYQSLKEIIVHQAKVSVVKSAFGKINSTQLNSIHIAQDAKIENTVVQAGITGWQPFGTEKNQMADIGFAISSPMLLAKDGRRRFSIEISSSSPIPRKSLRALYTGPKGWVEAVVDDDPGELNRVPGNADRFLLVKIEAALPAVVPYDEAIHKTGMSVKQPVVKILLKNDESFSNAYHFFTTLHASSIRKIVMNVEGSRAFSLESDTGKLNPLKPFKPFGNNPVKHKSYFIIGCKEAFNRYLSAFHLAMNWKSAPGNIKKYYLPYAKYLESVEDSSISTKTKTGFMQQWQGFDQGNVPGSMELLTGGSWKKIIEDAGNHYRTTKAEKYNIYHTTNQVTDDINIAPDDNFSTDARWGFAKVTLKYDFGHAFYPNVLTNAATKHPGNAAYFPAKPYTPEFNSLHLDYVLEDSFDTGSGEHELLQIHPFGYVENLQKQSTLVSAQYSANGQLYLGIEQCPSPQIINLYISRLDGTQDISTAQQEPPIWQYLSGNEWIDVSKEDIIMDSTSSFTESGFISIALKQDAFKSNTAMGQNLLWLRLISKTSAATFSAIVDIYTNATEAMFLPQAFNDPAHLSSPLAAGSITKPSIKIAGVKSVAQPFASYGGRMEENGEMYYTRASELLRHKGRAWALWDYEHLILEKFPSVYKAKCINHATSTTMYIPGNVLCIVLPSMLNISEKDILQPRLSQTVINEAGAYLAKCSTPFCSITVQNPVYEQIRVNCKVKIKAGFDETFYAKQLNTDLQTFFCPWINNRALAPDFGGKIYASAIINFIEDLPYIDYVTFFEAEKILDGKFTKWFTETSGSNEQVILTSVQQHLIDTNPIC